MKATLAIFVLTTAISAQASPDAEWEPLDGLPMKLLGQYQQLVTGTGAEDWEILDPLECSAYYELDAGGPELYNFEEEPEFQVYFYGQIGHQSVGAPEVISPVDDAVYEVLALAIMGWWRFGFDDGQRSLVITLTPDSVGFSGDGINFVAEAPHSGSGFLHLIRVEKHGQDHVTVFVDEQEVLQVAYGQLPESNDTFAGAGIIFGPPIFDPGFLWLGSYRHHVGDTFFPADFPVVDPPTCPGDINNDGTVNVLDLIELLLAFGTSCP